MNKKTITYIGATTLLILIGYLGYRLWMTREVRSLNSLAVLMDSGQYDKAEKDLRALIAGDTNNTRPYLLLAALEIEKLARSRHKAKDSKEIFATLDKVDKLAKNSESKRLRAMASYIMHRDFNAKKYAQEAINIDINNDKAWSLLGLLAEKSENYKLAEKYYNASYKKSRNSVEAMLGQARVLWQSGDKNKALAKASEAIKVATKRLEKAKAYYTSGHFNSSNHDYDKAILDLRASVSLSSNDYAVRGELANALYMSYVITDIAKRNSLVLDEALSHALASIKLNPVYSYGYYFAGKIYAITRNKEAAKNYFEASLKYATKAIESKDFITRINKELKDLGVKNK